MWRNEQSLRQKQEGQNKQGSHMLTPNSEFGDFDIQNPRVLCVK